MKITLNLENVTDRITLFESLSNQLIVKDWGRNWDALNDCLRDLDTGGFTEKYDFPLLIQFTNWKEFEAKSPQEFETFKDVFKKQEQEQATYGNELKTSFE